MSSRHRNLEPLGRWHVAIYFICVQIPEVQLRLVSRLRSFTISFSSTILSRLGERTGMWGLNELLRRLLPGDCKIIKCYLMFSHNT